jgi:hypothetical protein
MQAFRRCRQKCSFSSSVGWKNAHEDELQLHHNAPTMVSNDLLARPKRKFAMRAKEKVKFKNLERRDASLDSSLFSSSAALSNNNSQDTSVTNVTCLLRRTKEFLDSYQEQAVNISQNQPSLLQDWSVALKELDHSIYNSQQQHTGVQQATVVE